MRLYSYVKGCLTLTVGICRNYPIPSADINDLRNLLFEHLVLHKCTNQATFRICSLCNVYLRSTELPAGPAASVASTGATLISFPFLVRMGGISKSSSSPSTRVSLLCGRGTKCALWALFLSICLLQGLYSTTLRAPKTMKAPHIEPPKKCELYVLLDGM